MLHNKKGFIFWAIFLLFININSIFYPNYLSILYFVYFFSRKSINSSTAALYNFKLLTGISLIVFGAQFLFSFLVSAEDSNSKLPIYNIPTRYDVGFMVVFVRIWDDGFTKNDKIYYFIVTTMFLTYVFIASIIFYYMDIANK
jgi:hypothetical protein